jgi:valyl-tRNA synthetase
MDKHYDFKVKEKELQDFWDKKEIYKFDIKTKGEVYSVDTPPPTVSGAMHIGHAFSYAQQDFVIRYKRMRGFNVFYPFGTDDNGLPTERLVERTKKVKSTRMDRQEFRELCLKTVNEIKPEFVKPWKMLGISCDFKQSYSTIDPHCQKTSQSSFLNLYKKDLIYQEESPVSWCPKCQTAIAQAEFENVDMTSHFNDIVFKQKGKDLIIATTRPELLPACVALAVHPEDERYKDIIGKFATVPLFSYDVPIIKDEDVDKDKGTGIMMVCTFGDKEDVEKWYKHKLPLKVVIEKDGTMNDRAGKYKGLKLKEARQEILKDLKEEGLLIRQQDITHAVNLHDKCGTEIEILKTKQWFVKILEKKQDLIDAADKITWYPKHMKSRYIHWVENLNWDWCISRQRHYGVPIPVWYKDGKVILPKEDELPIDPLKDTSKEDRGTPEEDVFDTWMTSSLTPQIALRKVEDSELFKNFPMSLRPQAHDIIRTWAFYTITKAIYEDDDIPWKDIVISGHALDPHGKKMSKSKGNVVDPLKVMDQYGADALRFWAAGSKLGEDLPYQEKDIITGKKMVTKLWNASKFCLIHLSDFDEKSTPELKMMDRWLLSKLHKMIKSCTEDFDRYEYSKTKAETEKFFWNTFCDNYLEVSKNRLYNPDIVGQDATDSARFALYHSLLAQLKMIAPIMPHITDEIFRMFYADKIHILSIHNTYWPEWNEEMMDEEAEEIGDIAIEIIARVRKYKSDNNMSLKTELDKLKVIVTKDLKHFDHVLEDLKATTKAKEIIFEKGNEIEISIQP